MIKVIWPDDKKDMLKLNPGLKLIPEFSSLTHEQLLFVLLCTHPWSPLKQLYSKLKHKLLRAKCAEAVTTNIDKRRDYVAGANEDVEAAIALMASQYSHDEIDTLLHIRQKYIEFFTEDSNIKEKPATYFREAKALIDQNVFLSIRKSITQLENYGSKKLVKESEADEPQKDVTPSEPIQEEGYDPDA